MENHSEDDFNKKYYYFEKLNIYDEIDKSEKFNQYLLGKSWFSGDYSVFFGNSDFNRRLKRIKINKIKEIPVEKKATIEIPEDYTLINSITGIPKRQLLESHKIKWNLEIKQNMLKRNKRTEILEDKTSFQELSSLMKSKKIKSEKVHEK